MRARSRILKTKPLIVLSFIVSMVVLVCSVHLAIVRSNLDFSNLYFIFLMALITVGTLSSIISTSDGLQRIRSPRIGLTGALLIAAIHFNLNVKYIESTPLTQDEIARSNHATGLPFHGFNMANIVTAATAAQQPPIHYVCLAESLARFGQGELGARIPSALFSALALAGFVLLLEAFGASPIGIALFLGLWLTSKAFIIYARDASPYSAALFALAPYLLFTTNLLKDPSPYRHFVSVVSSGTFFVLTLGMQPPYFIASLAFATTFVSWRNRRGLQAFWLSSLLIAILTAPVMIGSIQRASLFIHSGKPPFISNGSPSFSTQLLDWFGSAVDFMSISQTAIILGLVLVLLMIALNFRSRISKTALLLAMTTIIFFVFITTSFAMFIAYGFQIRHALLALPLSLAVFALSADRMLRGLTLKFRLLASLRFGRTLARRAERISLAGIFLGIVVLLMPSIQHVPARMANGWNIFDARSVYQYIQKQLPRDQLRVGYSLEIVDRRSVGLSGLFGSNVYLGKDLDQYVKVNELPARHRPIWQYLLGDIDSGRRPDEIIFMSSDGLVRMPGALSMAEINWKELWRPADGVTTIKFNGLILTRVKVENSLLETAIRFFDSLATNFGNGSNMSLVHETRFRLFLRQGNCERASAAFDQIDPSSSSVSLRNEARVGLQICREAFRKK